MYELLESPYSHDVEAGTYDTTGTIDTISCRSCKPNHLANSSRIQPYCTAPLPNFELTSSDPVSQSMSPLIHEFPDTQHIRHHMHVHNHTNTSMQVTITMYVQQATECTCLV